MAMSWTLLLLLVIVILPLAGALLALLVGRFLPKQVALLVAAVPMLLSSVAVLLLIELVPPVAGLGQPVLPTEASPAAMRYAATSRWVQPPHSPDTTLSLPPTATPTPTKITTALPSAHPYSQVTVVLRNATGETGLATRTTRDLQARGFRVIEPEDDPKVGERPQTLILDRGDHTEVRQELARLLKVPAEQIEINSDEPSEADIVIILGDDFHDLARATPTATPTLVSEPLPSPTGHALSAVTISVLNGTRRQGLATRTASRLEEQGFRVIEVENDERGNRPHTLILDRGDHTDVRQALASFLKVDAEYVEVNASVDSEADIVVILGDDFKE